MKYKVLSLISAVLFIRSKWDNLETDNKQCCDKVVWQWWGLGVSGEIEPRLSKKMQLIRVNS